MPETAIAVDSALGAWTHHECRPTHLAGIVDHLWHFSGRLLAPRERTFPGGYLEILLHLGPLFRAVGPDGRTGEAFPEVCITGPQTRPLVIEAPDDSCCVLGIRLTPVGAYRVLATPLHLTTDLTLDFADVLGRKTTELAEVCRNARTVAERFRRVVVWLEHRLACASPPIHAGVSHAARLLATSHGQTRIAALQHATGLSRARFLTMFRVHTGHAPKEFARVLRFRHTLSALQSGARLSSAALESGYCDQAHMHRDFREFAGMTPAAFADAVRYPNSPSLPEAR